MDRPAQEFLDLNTKQATRAVAFMANAEPTKPRFNKAFTRMTATLCWRGKRVSVSVPVVDKSRWNGWDLGEWVDRLVDNLLSAFGLAGTWKSMCCSSSTRFIVHSAMRTELRRRGASRGIDLLDEQIRAALATGKPQQKRDARKARGELNRALAHLRKARKSGATVRQMNKLVRTIVGEEAVQETHES